jgi:UDP:flavonoid glycosyltransferase YjiC (YdhE family)
LLEPEVAEMAVEVEAACRDSDLILYSTFGMVAYYVAQKLGVSVISVPLQPLTRTGAFPNIAFPADPGWGAHFNRLTHRLGEQLFWQVIRPVVNRWTDQLGLPAASFWGPFGKLNNEGPPLVYGFSPQVVPKPADWGAHIHLAGYWFLEPEAGWEPSGELLAFLAAGPRPIYLGFGSMTHRDPEETARLVGQALALSGRRAVVLRGWGGLEAVAAGADIFVLERVPHAWLFPKVAAVVHHGGAGTTAAGLRAGVPAVVVPFFADQNFWAGRVAALGVGPEPVPRQQLTAAGLAGAIITATEDRSLRERAAELGRQLQAEDGVGRGVALIERLAAERTSAL